MTFYKTAALLTALLLLPVSAAYSGNTAIICSAEDSSAITEETKENKAVQPVLSFPEIELSLSEARRNPEVTFSLSINGADFKYSTAELWTSFDSRLKIAENQNGDYRVSKGNAVSHMSSELAPSRYYDNKKHELVDLNGIRFIASSGNNYGRDGNLFTVTVKLPDSVKAGDVFPLEIVRITRESAGNDFVNTTFINSLRDEDGLAMEKWLFENGIKNGYIKIGGGTQSVPGDANLDGSVTVADAVAILQYIANSSKYPLSDEALINADVSSSGDGVTGKDALAIQKFDAGVITSLPESILK